MSIMDGQNVDRKLWVQYVFCGYNVKGCVNLCLSVVTYSAEQAEKNTSW